MADTKTPDLAAVLDAARYAIRNRYETALGQQLAPMPVADLEALCAAAERVAELELVAGDSQAGNRRLLDALNEIVTQDAEIAALRVRLAAAEEIAEGRAIVERLNAKIADDREWPEERAGVTEEVYLAAVKGRKDFREAYWEQLVKVRELEAALESSRQQIEAITQDRRAMAELLDSSMVKDTRRLDWMQSHHASIWWGGILERRAGPDPDAVALEWLDDEGLVSQSARFHTLREAIDDAMGPGGKHETE